MSKAMSLKAKIRNIAKQKNIPAQVILQNYMFERLLVRLSASEYKEKFVLKGGMLVAAIVGQPGYDGLGHHIEKPAPHTGCDPQCVGAGLRHFFGRWRGIRDWNHLSHPGG